MDDLKQVISNTMIDNETWNTCPECDKDWKDPVATPGLIHRTRICVDCLELSRVKYVKTRKH
jgi:hypothetical protein